MVSNKLYFCDKILIYEIKEKKSVTGVNKAQMIAKMSKLCKDLQMLDACPYESNCHNGRRCLLYLYFNPIKPTQNRYVQSQ